MTLGLMPPHFKPWEIRHLSLSQLVTYCTAADAWLEAKQRQQ